MVLRTMENGGLTLIVRFLHNEVMADTTEVKDYGKTKEYGKGYGKRPLWQWIVLYAVIGVIVYALIYYFFFAKNGGYNSNSTSYNYNPTVTPQSSNLSITPGISPTAITEPSVTPKLSQNTVILTASVFSPATLTIKAGETVNWTNQSGQDATINSDPHPLHTNYPPLNLGTFSNGQTFSLAFPKSGTYGYHNHLDPSQRGTIIVE